MKFKTSFDMLYGVRVQPAAAAVKVDCAITPALAFNGIPIRFSDMCYTMETVTKRWKRAWPRQPKIRVRSFERPNMVITNFPGQGTIILCHPKLEAVLMGLN